MTKQILHASSFEKYLECPGALAAEDGLPESPASEAADSGTRIHNALRLYFNNTITDVRDIATLCNLDEHDRIVLRWFINKAETVINAEGAVNRWAELELPATGDKITGRADLVTESENGKYTVFDWKSGFGRQVVATKNLQLRVYIVKVAEMFGCPSITGHLFSVGNQAEDMAFTSVTFGPDEIKAAREEIYAVRDACFETDAKRCPGAEQCKWCLAAGNPERCPESLEFEVAEVEMLAIRDPITPELASKCAGILYQIAGFEKSAEMFKAMVKDKLIREPDSIPGLKLKDGDKVRSITDATKAFEMGVNAGFFSQEEFVANAITVKLPAVKTLAKARLKGKVKAKDISDLVNDKLKEVIEVKQKAPSIVRKESE